LNPSAPVIPAEITTELRSLGRDFTEHRALIDHRISSIFQAQSTEVPHISETNSFLGDDISAAIALGSLDFLGPEILWIKNMQRRMNSAARIHEYLKIYEKAVNEELGSAGEPISRWISNAYSIIKG